MSDIEFTGKRTTKPTGFSLSPYIVKKLEDYAVTGKYGNKSAIAQQALSEFFAKEDAGIKEESIDQAVAAYLRSPEGEALIRSILRKSLTASDEEAAETPVIEKQ